MFGFASAPDAEKRGGRGGWAGAGGVGGVSRRREGYVDRNSLLD